MNMPLFEKPPIFVVVKQGATESLIKPIYLNDIGNKNYDGMSGVLIGSVKGEGFSWYRAKLNNGEVFDFPEGALDFYKGE